MLLYWRCAVWFLMLILGLVVFGLLGGLTVVCDRFGGSAS
jgi:hypothetical protein